MTDILSALAPVFLLIGLGFALKRLELVPEAFWAPAERLTFYLFFPALLVTNTAGAGTIGKLASVARQPDLIFRSRQVSLQHVRIQPPRCRHPGGVELVAAGLGVTVNNQERLRVTHRVFCAARRPIFSMIAGKVWQSLQTASALVP